MPSFAEPPSVLHGRFARAAACLVGAALALLALAASQSGLGIADARVTWLAMSTALWLVWVAADFGLSARRPAGADQPQSRHDVAGDSPAFVDTESTWKPAA